MDEELLKQFGKDVVEMYKRLIASGALEPTNFSAPQLTRLAIRLAAENMITTTAEKAAFKNLTHFV